MFKKLLFFLVSRGHSLVASSAVTWLAYLRPLRDPGASSRRDRTHVAGRRPGPDAALVETRGITIDAPPEAVWPWLVQMGYGRGGWYSYDQMDNSAPSADRIMPELQDLSVGDIMPTWPGGGFRVADMTPGESMSLYLDSEMVKAQQHAPMRAGDRGVHGRPEGRGWHGRRGDARVPGELDASCSSPSTTVRTPAGGAPARMDAEAQRRPQGGAADVRRGRVPDDPQAAPGHQGAGRAAGAGPTAVAA